MRGTLQQKFLVAYACCHVSKEKDRYKEGAQFACNSSC